MAFRPLSKRNLPDDGAPDALHDGIPTWLQPSLAQYLWREINASMDQYDRSGVHDLVRRTALKLHLDLDWHRAEESLVEYINDPVVGLDVIDCVLHLGGRARESSAAKLALALNEGGSAWGVTRDGDTFCLERRVDETVAAAAKQAMSEKTSAATYLRSAWQDIYGRDPNPSNAYHEAVRAVEAAGASIVIPKDKLPTLGKMIPAMRDAPHKWAMRFTEPGVDPIPVVVQMMQLLWHSQFDRHGRVSTDKPVKVTQKEAEDAVQLAVVLVEWFQSGAITVV